VVASPENCESRERGKTLGLEMWNILLGWWESSDTDHREGKGGVGGGGGGRRVGGVGFGNERASVWIIGRVKDIQRGGRSTKRGSSFTKI